MSIAPARLKSAKSAKPKSSSPKPPRKNLPDTPRSRGESRMPRQPQACVSFYASTASHWVRNSQLGGGGLEFALQAFKVLPDAQHVEVFALGDWAAEVTVKAFEVAVDFWQDVFFPE